MKKKKWLAMLLGLMIICMGFSSGISAEDQKYQVYSQISPYYNADDTVGKTRFSLKDAKISIPKNVYNYRE